MIEEDKIVVFSGAGISAESGLQTFRDSNGLWNNYPIHKVATPEAWQSNPELDHGPQAIRLSLAPGNGVQIRAADRGRLDEERVTVAHLEFVRSY